MVEGKAFPAGRTPPPHHPNKAVTQKLDEPLRQAKCAKCDKTFVSLNYLKNHVKNWCKGKPPDPNERQPKRRRTRAEMEADRAAKLK